MEEFFEKVDAFGETLLNWADPDNQFRGYTEVRLHNAGSGMVLCRMPTLSMESKWDSSCGLDSA
jgi:hypothetical protein